MLAPQCDAEVIQPCLDFPEVFEPGYFWLPGGQLFCQFVQARPLDQPKKDSVYVDRPQVKLGGPVREERIGAVVWLLR